MGEVWFYIQLGFNHVMDLGAYDHILFLAALALPFRPRSWKKLLILATVFTVTHCLSLALSAYGVLSVNVALIEFLIPVTILLTACFSMLYAREQSMEGKMKWHTLATAFFGIIHGFGFSNYFNLLMAEEENKLTPLLSFALGIEISQVVIVLSVVLLGLVVRRVFGLKRQIFVLLFAFIIILITIPMLIRTFPA